jgi:hypothetical protein
MDNIQLTQPDVRYLETPLLLRNANNRFVDVSSLSGPVFQRPLAARGVAFGDFNNDGFVDIAINCNAEPAVLLKNSGNASHWLIVNTIGKRSNRDGIGAELHLTASDGKEQYGFVSTASSYLSASDKRIHFGLAGANSVKLLEIRWPGGTIQRLSGIKANQILNVREP